ncbi:T-complex protein 1 subunit alpha [Encephalitozoon hellem ATCC 50504]|uniref:T-complex protein 1 subunit alpha n=1 Tax=Encephalitozoon hellem TaxID=27973 RepID=A0A9Q9F8W9_ENCHE|nr:T-complex protein 1 subunit alpha [Encephalitozoon hellem ATCC 50504]AFM97909.1 T-complex protein 1 subunit alpha [Encephalitozoon hellem ATCC 50504]UTX42711.1 T complex protein subunit beta [Encephalitozoon hellem]WEL38170.1 T complex protein subunit [Encephalitozoon hellem]|eukprot:XP_003886890.1 T-complex protein 1 subunit alpha [Encephalitozoon hellem ATCC 50504]
MNKEISTADILSGGESYSGISAVERNAKAMMKVYNAIKTSFGPLGLDKMCVDSAGEVSITNDGATILQNMVVDDPAAKILVDLATHQDHEVGDGTTSVVLIAASLIEKGAGLIASGVHPSVVVSGYKMAFNECVQFIKKSISKSALNLGPKALKNVVKTSISSKVINSENELFCGIVIDALKCIESTGENKKNTYPIEDINILKHPGGSMKESFLYQGYALNCSLASNFMKKQIKKPKILCIDFGLQKYKNPLTVSIVVDDPNRLEDIRKKELEITKKQVKAIIDSGADVVLTTRGIDDMCTKILLEAGIVGVRRCKKEDLVVIAKATGTGLVNSISDLNGTDSITALGSADKFEVVPIGEEECILINGLKRKMASIILRGANSQLLDEMQRSVHDAICVLKRTLESNNIVPGGGSVECALSLMLEKFAFTVNSKEHVAIHRYAESLLSIPKILATNAGLDSNEIVASLMSSQSKESAKSSDSKFLGIDVTTGRIQDNFEHGIIEPSMNKMKSLKAATEAAISILRINEVIILPPDQSKN